MKRDIRDLVPEELKREITAMGEPAHRARQIFMWLNRKSADSFTEMTDLPKRFITELDKRFVIGALECAEQLKSKDGTEKFLWRLEDGQYIETVLIREARRRTLCLSTQVGCRFKCPFCASGIKGFIRDLRASEIVNQLLQAQKLCDCRVTNIVFMGMGEPLDNYDNLEKAIRIINHPGGTGLGARKITVSTCGIIPGILKLQKIGLQVELSVSLHAASNHLRDELVPVNRKYPLEKLISACEKYYKKTGRVITLEYTLIGDKNDSIEEAEKLGQIANRLKAKINLIECSPVCAGEGLKPDRKKLTLFVERLRSKKAAVTVRKSKGVDIMAACGQLALRRAKRKSEK
ncbi:MAG: 23S rRNA (adenine(2503)-C(2))-methyltransferase RlmN [Candidatus Omnitrophota bacterium]